MLEKCLHGKTQNSNEALHGLIRQRCPKNSFSGKKIVELGVVSAVCHMNDGSRSIANVLERMALETGKQASMGFERSARKRKRKVSQQNLEKVKRRRKELRSMKKGWDDAIIEEEGATYDAGKV